jgi:hypothetical protein
LVDLLLSFLIAGPVSTVNAKAFVDVDGDLSREALALE